MLRDAEARSKVRTPASFNPDLAVVGDFRGSVSTDNDNPARNRFDIGSVELDLRAAVDPRADGVVILPASRDVEDLGLPDCDGCDLLDRVKKLFSVKSIALSGLATVADVEKSRSAGFDLHLSKPVDLPRLLAAIDKDCRPIPPAAKE